jgi:rod shape determining protein RodA
MDSNWRNFDLPAWLATLVLMILGGVLIYSAYEASQPAHALIENLVFRQGLFALGGMVLYFLAAALDYHLLIRLHRWLYLFIIVILLVTLALGQIFFGARSWFEVHAFTIQPSELCKVLMIVVLAKYLGDEKADLESPGPLLTTLLLVLPPAVLIYLQSDFGTALILVAIWLGMCFLAGVRWRHMALLAGAGIVAVPLIWFRLKGYMRDRILMFLFPGYDPSGASYNINQALISIGSGGFWGKGLLRGTQSQLHFLRVRHTDFIFSVLAEELGFVGAMLLLGLFAFLILRLVRAAGLARDAYGQLIVSGVATMVAVQTLINLGMNANLLPVTGLPLPLVSYGGSSLITTLLALGLAQSVILRHKPATLPLP